MFNKLNSRISFLLYSIIPLVLAQYGPFQQGFIIYCPCMGRFGNQAEQLLGSLLFAKALDRTLVLPPFIFYGPNHNPELVPFEDIIQVEPIRGYHDVMLLTDFMRYNATEIWPKGERQFYCYSARDPKSNYCDALKGQPYKTFWTEFNVSEDRAMFHKPLSTTYDLADKWRAEYPIFNHRVLTFVGAPSPFPAHKESIKLQKYIKISTAIEESGVNFLKKENLLGIAYLSMHIRHGSDWARACSLLKSKDGLAELFSSAQCANRDDGVGPKRKLTHEACLPSYKTIKKKLNDSLNNYQVERNSEIHHVHIATDNSDSHILNDLRKDFPHTTFILTSHYDHKTSSMLDIYLMTRADVFIGNCVSSFSAFPARLRSQQPDMKRTTHYFGLDIEETKNNHVNEEL